MKKINKGLLTLLLMLTQFSYAQTIVSLKAKNAATIDTRGLDYYINIAEILKKGDKPAPYLWDSLFATPYFNLAINKFNLTTKEKQQKEIELVYSPSSALTKEQEQEFQHHLEYKKNLESLKVFSAALKDGSIRNTIQQYLYPFLPLRLQKEEFILLIIYTYYYSEEANGMEDMILQDALLAWKMDSYKKGLLTAHEAFHSVISKAGTSRTKINLEQVNTKSIVVNILSGIAQEGVADLIDKEEFSQLTSPMYEMVSAMMQDDEKKSQAYIKALDSSIIALPKNAKIKNPRTFSQSVMGFAGHQPGRYMGKIIRDAGLLPELIVDIENPFLFFYTYNIAALKLGTKSPVFLKNLYTG